MDASTVTDVVMQTPNETGVVPSSQPETDGIALDDVEVKMLIRSEADQLDQWFRKLANIEKRHRLYQSTINGGCKNPADIPVECRLKQLELPTLPATLAYSAETKYRVIQMRKEQQVAFLQLVCTDLLLNQIPSIETSISDQTAKAKKAFQSLNFSTESIALYTAMVDEKRRSRENLLTTAQATGSTSSKSKGKKSIPKTNTNPESTGQDQPAEPPSFARSRPSFKPRHDQHRRRPYDGKRGGHNKRRDNQKPFNDRDSRRR